MSDTPVVTEVTSLGKVIAPLFEAWANDCTTIGIMPAFVAGYQAGAEEPLRRINEVARRYVLLLESGEMDFGPAYAGLVYIRDITELGTQPAAPAGSEGEQA